MDTMQKRRIPGWVWAILAVLILVATIALFVTDRRQEPGDSYTYDVSRYAQTDPAHVLFKEIKRISLSIPSPSALTVGTDNTLYVGGEKIVIKMDSQGNESARFALHDTPGCLALAPDGKILLGFGDHMEVLDPASSSTTAWPSFGERALLTSISVNESGVYAADAGNRVVHHFDFTGTLKGRLGERTPNNDAFGLMVPSGYLDVATDPMGALWVVNPGKHGLEQYRDNGELVSSWYRPGMETSGFCGCCNPIHIAFRSDGTLVTAEKGLNRVKLYGPDTSFIGVVAPTEAFQAPGSATLGYEEEPPIKDLAVDRDNRILVLHGAWNVILIYEQISTPETAG